jgi:hypothetical protein
MKRPGNLLHYVNKGILSLQLENYADVLRLLILNRALTAVESPEADTLVLHFGPLSVTLHLEARPDAIRVDGAEHASPAEHQTASVSSSGGQE